MTLPPEDELEEELDQEPILAPGVSISGKYEIVRLIGRGGMGLVYEALHKRLEHRVAIKMLSVEAKRSPNVVKRFEQEARTAVQLRGRHVAQIQDVDSLDDGSPFIVMEFLEGHDLADEIVLRQKLPVGDAVLYIVDACEGMAEAHRLGIVHRDLKPANLFLTAHPDGAVVKVLDFGISKLKNRQSLAVTSSQAIFGSPHYMSPEQIRAASDVDQRSDVWSLGVILYEMLTGDPPFGGAAASAIIAAIVSETPRPLEEVRADVPAPLAAAVMKALSREPNDRFASVEDFARAIAPYAAKARPRLVVPQAQNALVSRTAATVPEPVRPRPAAALEVVQTPVSTTADPVKPSPRRAWLFFGVGTAILVAAVFANAAYRARTSGDAPLPSETGAATSTARPTAGAPSAAVVASDVAVPDVVQPDKTDAKPSTSAEPAAQAPTDGGTPTKASVSGPAGVHTEAAPVGSAGRRKFRTNF